MTKALDKGIEIRDIVLQRKTGGKSGEYRRKKKYLYSHEFHGKRSKAPSCGRQPNGFGDAGACFGAVCAGYGCWGCGGCFAKGGR